MSRGGRGGGRGGARAKPGTARIGGIEIQYDEDIEEGLRGRPLPSKLYPVCSSISNFPPHILHPILILVGVQDYPDLASPCPLSHIEKSQVQKILAFRQAIHEGKMYTVLGAQTGNVQPGKKTGTGQQMVKDPFEGMPSYSQKYVKQRRTLPDFSGRAHGES